MKPVSTLLYSLLFFSLSASLLQAQRKEPEKTKVHGHTMYTLLNPGEIMGRFGRSTFSYFDTETRRGELVEVARR